MTSESQIFDVLITSEDLAKLRQENKDMKEENDDLKFQNQEFSKIIRSLTEMKGQVKELSNSNLQLSLAVILLRQKIEDGVSLDRGSSESIEQRLSSSKEQNQDMEIMLIQAQQKESILRNELQQSKKLREFLQERLQNSLQLQSQYEEDLVTAKQHVKALNQQLQSTMRKSQEESQLSKRLKQSEKALLKSQCEKELFELKTKHSQSSVKDFELRLQQKDQKIKQLTSKLQVITNQIKSGKEAREQSRICKTWKLTPMHLEKAQEIYSFPKDKEIQRLKLIIEELQDKGRKQDYLFINERYIIEQFRKELEEKETKLAQAENKLRIGQNQLARKTKNWQQSLVSRRESMQSEYLSKIKSLKQFSQCPQCDRKRQAYQTVIKQLKWKLQKSDRLNVQKQEQLAQVLVTTKEGNQIPIEVALKAQIASVISKLKIIESVPRTDDLPRKKNALVSIILKEFAKMEKDLECNTINT